MKCLFWILLLSLHMRYGALVAAEVGGAQSDVMMGEDAQAVAVDRRRLMYYYHTMGMKPFSYGSKPFNNRYRPAMMVMYRKGMHKGYYKGGYKGKGGYYKKMKVKKGKGRYYMPKGKGKGYYNKGGQHKPKAIPMGVWKRKPMSGALFGGRQRPPAPTPTSPSFPTPTVPTPTAPTPTAPTPTVPTPTNPSNPTAPTPTTPAVTNIDWLTDFSVADVTFVETQTQYIRYDPEMMEGNTVTNTFILPPNTDVEVYIVDTEDGPIDPAAGCPPGEEADRDLVYQGNDVAELDIEFNQVDQTFVLCDTAGNVIAAKEIVFQPVPPPFADFETVYTDAVDFSSAASGGVVQLDYLYQADSTVVFDGFLSNPALTDDAVYFVSPQDAETFTPQCPPDPSNAVSIEEYVDPSDADDELAFGLEFDSSSGTIQYVIYCSGTETIGWAQIRFQL